MKKYLNKEAYDLSLGQKQRITIAGVLSVEPKVIVMDEPTAMLDPEGKEDVRKIVKKLKDKGFTIIYITNIIDEIFLSDKVIVLKNGWIAKEFKISDILENVEFLKQKGIAIPKAIEMKEKLDNMGIDVKLSDLI